MAEVKDYSADALLAKEREVELDTDDVKEENVEVKEETKEDNEPKLNLGEVDLGYVDHSKEDKSDKPSVEEVLEEETKTEAKDEDKSDDKDDRPNLKKSRRDYQGKIDKLTFRIREAERREKAALEYAKGIQKKFDTSLKKFKSTDEQYLKELDARVDAQREQVKVALQQAIESQDASKIMEANDKLTQLAVEKEKARIEIANREEQKKQEEEQSKQQQNVQADTSNTAESSQSTPQITPKAKKWAEDNPWFGTDEVMTNAAITIHNNISQEGIEVDSDEYYNEVNSRLRKYFPESFDDNDVKDEPKKEKPKPVQTVASAGRSQQGRRTVKLTRSQVAIANRLGVPLEEYARYVKEDK
jgi:hypothetical protein